MFVSPPPSTYFRFRTGIFDLKRSSRGQTPPAIFHFIYLLKNIFLKDEKDVGRWHCGSVFNWSSASSAQDAVVIATVGDRVDSEMWLKIGECGGGKREKEISPPSGDFTISV